MDINYVGSGSWCLVTVTVMMSVNATECIGKKILSTNHDFDTRPFYTCGLYAWNDPPVVWRRLDIGWHCYIPLVDHLMMHILFILYPILEQKFVPPPCQGGQHVLERLARRKSVENGSVAAFEM